MSFLFRNSFLLANNFVKIPAFLAPSLAPSIALRPGLSHTVALTCTPRRYSPSARTVRAATALSSSPGRRKRSKPFPASRQRASPKPRPQTAGAKPLDGDESTLLSFVKRKSDEGGVRRVFDAVKAAEEGESDQHWPPPDGPVYRNAIRFLLRADRLDLALELYHVRSHARAKRPHELPSDFRLTAAVLRAVVRSSSKRSERSEHSEQIFAHIRDDCIRLCNARSESLSQSDGRDDREKRAIEHVVDAPDHSQADSTTSQDDREGVVDADEPYDLSARYMALALFDALTSLFTERDRIQNAPAKSFQEGDLSRGAEAVRLLKRLSQTYGNSAGLTATSYNELIRLVGKARQVMLVFDILDAMKFAGVEKDGTTFEFLANAIVRQVDFVTGAVSMDTLPQPLGAEVAFVGRSNVGKSSLVNMLVNRKALAYVSGRPGKTQQFNYFVVNQRDPSSAFHLVDLPGVGYAKVPRPIQDEWKRFMIQYFRLRTSLRLVFHLIDGRHGALADDEILMTEMGKLKGAFHYVVVLTKMDKMDKQKASRKVLDTTRNALLKCGCGSDVPIVATSAQSRLGRDEMWRHLQTGLRTLQPSASR